MTTDKSIKSKKQKQAIIRLITMTGIVVCVNILASYYHYGIDLTKEKRFTLTGPTKKLLNNLTETVEVDVYLKGKFPAEIQRLQEAVRERLQSFKDIAGNRLVYRFSDPFEGKSEDEQKNIANALDQKGIKVMPLQVKGEEEYSVKPFFPWAMVRYNGREKPIKLTETVHGGSPAENISYSESLLEYKFASAINEMGRPDKPRIAYITGNGEPIDIHIQDAISTLMQYYHLDTLNLTQGIHIPILYDAIIITKPTVAFTEPEKLKIDQYVMHGGHILWALSMLNASLDSLTNAPMFIALDYGLNLDDMLFNYGVRINSNLIEDMQCEKLPTFYNGNSQEPRPWIYSPVFDPTSQHIIVRNMQPVLSMFPNSIDTIATPGIKKTILLQSSKYSRSANAPVRVSLSTMNYLPRENMFNKHSIPAAVLLEGAFHSAYKNRLAAEYLHILNDSLHLPFKGECDSSNSMIVISDGNIMSNDYATKEGVLPMGYWKWTGNFYSNKDFLLNCMEYLTDRSGILEARSKESKLRLLDSGRVKEEKDKWEIINVVVPVAIVLVFASCYFFFRKRRYET